MTATVLAEKLAALAAQDCAAARTQRANLTEWEAALALVPYVPVQADDGFSIKIPSIALQVRTGSY